MKKCSRDRFYEAGLRAQALELMMLSGQARTQQQVWLCRFRFFIPQYPGYFQRSPRVRAESWGVACMR
mgnify:CR=1 FL=1